MTSTASARRPWLALAGCAIVSIGFNAYLFAPASILPSFVTAFAIDKPAAGLAISVVFLAWALFQIPSGFLMDRYDNRRLVLAGAVLFLGVSAASLVTTTYPAFLATRFVGGIAAVFLWTANANIVSQSFPPQRRALGTSLFVASAPAGVTLAQAAGPTLVPFLGWQGVVAVYGVVTLCGLPLFVWALDQPVRNESALSAGNFVAALGNRRVLAIALSSFCAYSLFVFLNSWMPTYATEVVGVDIAVAGALTALVPAMGLVARPGGGWLSDRLGGRRRPVIVAAFLLVVPALVGAGLSTSVVGFAAALLLAGIGSQLGTGVFYVFVEEVAPTESAGTSLSVLMTLSITGSLVAPVAAGWLVETLSWTTAFVVAGLVAACGIAAVARLPKSATGP
ncbi:MFS transporter [Haladaptatus sp. GCM10025707]|uniref:MFS transporter n=1 Tax=unclassified Haladaptatus TaxID=2622732 RepID=UPI0023E8B5EB|nr:MULTISPECIES: MFS transporter [unclassified Haladaptatus]